MYFNIYGIYHTFHILNEIHKWECHTLWYIFGKHSITTVFSWDEISCKSQYFHKLHQFLGIIQCFKSVKISCLSPK